MHMLLLAWLLSQPATPAMRERIYGFAAKDYFIEMKVHHPAPYRGKRLVFYSSLDPKREICYSADGRTAERCIERFVGAAALVTYSVKLPNGKLPDIAAIREHVTVAAQSPGLAERPPFSRTQKLTKGIGSDIQVFGYEERDLKGTSPQQLKALWRLYRQELYVDQEAKPFAVVIWKHTLDRISVVEIYAPPD